MWNTNFVQLREFCFTQRRQVFARTQEPLSIVISLRLRENLASLREATLFCLGTMFVYYS